MLRRIAELYKQEGVEGVQRGIHDSLMLNSFKLVSPLMGGESVWDREWDILCILDGCRTDTFKKVYTGTCSSIRSVGSTSPEWIQNTFDEIPSGVAYISANPHSEKVNDDLLESFHLEPVQKN